MSDPSTPPNQPASEPGSRARSVAFLSEDAEELAELVRGLRRAIGEVIVLQSLEQVGSLPPSSLVAVHYDARAPTDRNRLVSDFGSTAGGPTLLLLSEKRARHNFAQLFGSHVLTNMLVINGNAFNDNDLLVTVRKLRGGDIFGIEKYFAPGVETNRLRVSTTAEKNWALGTITEYAGVLGIPSRLRMLIRTVADEYLTNALYNAPVAADGTRKYSARPRNQPVALEPGETIDFRFCYDGQRFGISASDPFGSLEPVQVQDYLAKGFRAGEDQVSMGTGGAGLGFFQILDSLSHFVINLDRGRRTEMIGLVEVSGGYRNFAEAGKSFNIFVNQGTP